MSGSLKVGGSELINDSGGSGSLQWGSGVPKGSIIEQFMSPCDGSSVTVQSGTYTVQNVTGGQDATSSFVDLSGSVITYNPPAGTARVIYEFTFHSSRGDDARPILSVKYSIGGTEVTNARRVIDANSLEFLTAFKWVHNIGGSTTASTGRVASWTSGLELKLEVREWSSDYEGRFHITNNWEGGGTDQFSQPVIGITALA